MASVIAPPAAWSEAYEDVGDDLHPDEVAGVRAACIARRREFASGRACARRAIKALAESREVHEPGRQPSDHRVPLARGRDGAPAWPVGLTGSITHCDGYRAAAVARIVDVRAVGIDAELRRPLPIGVGPLVLTRGEADALPGASSRLLDLPWDTIAFSAKESAFKALSRCMIGGFDPLQLVVAVSTDASLVVRPLRPVTLDGRRVAEVSGRWTVTATHVATAVVLVAGTR